MRFTAFPFAEKGPRRVLIAICMVPGLFGWRPGAGNSEDVPKMMLYACFSHVRLEMFCHAKVSHTRLIAICMVLAAFSGPLGSPWAPSGPPSATLAHLGPFGGLVWPYLGPEPHKDLDDTRIRLPRTHPGPSAGPAECAERLNKMKLDGAGLVLLKF